MAANPKKGGSIEPARGRPPSGALSTYPQTLAGHIRSIREDHDGWGAVNILIELEEGYHYSRAELPGIASVNRFLRQNGFVKEREPSNKLPSPKRCQSKVRRPHDLWELDAQGAVKVAGIDYQALINIKDHKSKVHCMAFPASVKNEKSQPSTLFYYWALRLAFAEWGLPRAIQVDKDSVFYENRSKSPFPKTFHLWLIGLGIDLCFIPFPPPSSNAIVERSHQTMERQVIMGQQYDCWKSFFQACNNSRDRMNKKLPNRMLDKMPPLQAFPKAVHTGRWYSLPEEQTLINMKKVYRYLAKCTWYRKTSSAKTISLGGQIYYLKDAKPHSQLQITFCNKNKKLLFRDAKELLVAKLPIKNLTVEYLMGASTKSLLSMNYKLSHSRDCPIKT